MQRGPWKSFKTMNLDDINQLLSYLDKIQGLSAAGLVFLLCIAIGYGWKALPFKWFPNNAIPMAVMGTGAIAMMLMADGRPTTMPPHVWTVRNLVVGFIIGAIAWAVHNYALARLEKWIASKMLAKQDSTNNNSGDKSSTDEEPKPNGTAQ